MVATIKSPLRLPQVIRCYTLDTRSPTGPRCCSRVMRERGCHGRYRAVGLKCVYIARFRALCLYSARAPPRSMGNVLKPHASASFKGGRHLLCRSRVRPGHDGGGGVILPRDYADVGGFAADEYMLMRISFV